MILEIQYNESNRKEKVEVKSNKCIIGRSSKSDVQIDMECFSRSHLEVEWNEKDFFVTDLNSTNGIFINNEKVPAGVKTPFKNFFPIEIGGKVSIYIFPDDSQSASPDTSSIASEGPKEKTGSHNRTKTTQVPYQPKSKAKAQEKKGSSINVGMILPVIVLAGAVLYFWQDSQKQDDQLVTTAQVETGVKEAIKAPAITVVETDLKASLINKCDEFGDLCSNLKLKRKKEGVNIVGDQLIIFINLTEFRNEIESTYINKEPESDQREYLMAYYAFQPEIIKTAKKRKLAHIVVAGIDTLDELVLVKASVAVDANKVFEFSPEEHKAFFSNIFYGGVNRPFRVHLKPLMKISSY